MKRICLWCSGLIIFAAVMLSLDPQAHAYTMSQFTDEMKALDAQRVQVEKRLGLPPQVDTYQHATSYYDDMVEHDEQGQLRIDVVKAG